MSEEAEFYASRDPRTLGYDGREEALEAPVGIRVAADGAATRAGHAAALALVNMAARTHRRIHLVVPQVRSLARTPFSSSSWLLEAMIETAQAINPYVRLGEGLPGGAPLATVGHADAAQGGFSIAATGATARLGCGAGGFSEDSATVLGAAMAACLGASALFRSAHGLPVAPGVLSVWERETNRFTRTGPAELGRLDVGRVAMIGAGAVGSALSYWLHEVEYENSWEIVDRDVVKLHNTNRSLGMSAADAGWRGREPRSKAEVAAALVGAQAHRLWYDEWVEALPDKSPDLILPLANEYGVRRKINRRGEAVILHATTSRWWQANYHRHIAGRDGCLECRLPDDAHPELICSKAPLGASVDRSADALPRQPDAALPFLSGAAGVLLLAALYRLQRGDLETDHFNAWAVSFRGRLQIDAQLWRCDGGCEAVLPPTVRRKLSGRWRAIDAD